MKIETNGMSTREELEAARQLVASCTATLACGCSLDQDERDSADDLRRICSTYIQAYVQRYIL